MRHRITSFRCVEATSKMSHAWLNTRLVIARICVRLLRFVPPIQTRQSSITLPTSDQGGITSAATPDVLNPIRPRLEAIASSSGSNAARSAATRPAAASKVAGKVFFSELVHTHIVGDAEDAAFRRATRRVDRVQRIVNCGALLSFAKVASLPVAVVA